MLSSGRSIEAATAKSHRSAGKYVALFCIFRASDQPRDGIPGCGPYKLLVSKLRALRREARSRCDCRYTVLDFLEENDGGPLF